MWRIPLRDETASELICEPPKKENTDLQRSWVTQREENPAGMRRNESAIAQRSWVFAHTHRAKPWDLQFASPHQISISATLRSGIPSKAEGSAVRFPYRQACISHHSPLCHPERSRGNCTSLRYHQASVSHPPPLCHPERSRGIFHAVVFHPGPSQVRIDTGFASIPLRQTSR